MNRDRPVMMAPSKHPLFALGFRPFYLFAAAFALVAILIWLAMLTDRVLWAGNLAGVLWHGHEMVFGFVAAVIAGFLFTAVRNWTGLPTPTGRILALIATLWFAARVTLVTGPSMVAVALDVAFLPIITAAVAVPILQSRNVRNYKIVVILLALSGLHVAYHIVHPRWLLIASVDVIVVLFALVGGRVIPAFTRNAVPGSNPRHVRWVEIAAFGSLGSIAILDVLYPQTGPFEWLPALLLLAAVSHVWRLALWQPWLTVRNPLLLMLPVAYAWLPAALLLRMLALHGIVAGSAWLHALTAGALSGMMMAMMMRSSLGHTGRALVASHTDLAAFVLLQLAAATRVLAGTVGDYRAMLLIAAALWALAFAALLLRYAPIWWRPRVDGKPG